MKHNQSCGEDHKHTKRTNEKKKKKPFRKGTVAKDENLARAASKDSKNEKIQKAVQMMFWKTILIDSKSVSSDTEGSCDETKVLFYKLQF